MRLYEIHLDGLQDKKSSVVPTDFKMLNDYNARISHTEDLLEIARKNLRKTQEINSVMEKNFKEIVKPTLYASEVTDGNWTTNITRDEKTRILKSLGYRFMIEKIVINKSEETVQVHFYPEIAEIL